jgi:hypothetical protein
MLQYGDRGVQLKWQSHVQALQRDQLQIAQWLEPAKVECHEREETARKQKGEGTSVATPTSFFLSSSLEAA